MEVFAKMGLVNNLVASVKHEIVGGTVHNYAITMEIQFEIAG